MTGPAHVPGPTVAPSAWASVRLIQGASKANQWQIDSSTTRAQLTIGADKSCDWPVEADRVAAIHFELFWDGRRLWIADTHEAGGVTVDGARLTSWQPITGRARIEFGAAVMVAECSVPAVSVERPIEPPPSMDMNPTNRRPGQGGSAEDDERTTLHVRHDSHGPGAAGKGPEHVPLHAAPTTISEMPAGGIQPFGGPPPMPPGSGMAPPDILQAKKPVMAVPTIISEPGRGLPPIGMMQMPNPPMARGPMGMGMGMPTPDPAGAMRPAMPPMHPPPHGMVQPMHTPPGRAAWMDRMGLPKTSLPPRTWGLVILTVAALMFVMFMGGDDKKAPRRRVAKKAAPAAAATSGQAQSGTTTPQPAGTEIKPAGTEIKPAGTETAAPAASETAAPASSASKTAESKTGQGKTAENKAGESKTAESKTGQGKTAESKAGESKTAESKAGESKTAAAEPSAAGASATAAQAADLLLAGRQREALAVYDELSRVHPDQPGFAAIVKILKRRLADKCKDKQPGESPCPPAQ